MMSPDRILLIDPYKNLVTTYRIILEEEKYLVEIAANLEEARLLIETRPYAIMITEFLSPFHAVNDLIRLVKKKAPETCIIVLTETVVDEQTYERLFELGVDDFILKPYSPAKILVHIRKGVKQRDLVLKSLELEKQAVFYPMAEGIGEVVFSTSYFKRCLRKELKRAKRHHRGLSLLLIHMPDRKRLGDRFEGFRDKLGKILRIHTREEDVVGRQNGDLGILLPDTDHAGSQALVGRLSNLIRTDPRFESDEILRPITQTLSFQSFTYPDKFTLPRPLKDVMEEVEGNP